MLATYLVTLYTHNRRIINKTILRLLNALISAAMLYDSALCKLTTDTDIVESALLGTVMPPTDFNVLKNLGRGAFLLHPV